IKEVVMIQTILTYVVIAIAILQLVMGTISGRKMGNAIDQATVNKHGFNMINNAITFGACLMIIKFFLMA
ncbi:hypothetical protein, partial [Herbiconiux daphne]